MPIWKKVLVNLGIVVVTVLAMQGIFRVVDERSSLPHSVYVDRVGPNGGPGTVDPSIIIPKACGNDQGVSKLITNGWDWDKSGRKYQDYEVKFNNVNDRVDVARMYLDDASVRCP